MTRTEARRVGARAVFVAITCAAAVFTAATGAVGAWATTGPGAGSGRAFVMPAGWTYVETPVQLSWTGAAGPASQPVTVSS